MDFQGLPTTYSIFDDLVVKVKEIKLKYFRRLSRASRNVKASFWEYLGSGHPQKEFGL